MVVAVAVATDIASVESTQRLFSKEMTLPQFFFSLERAHYLFGAQALHPPA